MSLEPLVLHVLVRITKTGVTAHCLEIDHLTEALTQEDALSDIADLVRSQFVVARREKDFDNLFFPAPVDDWRMLARARLVGDRLVDLRDPQAGETTLPPMPVAVTGVKLQVFVIDA
jgi:hypothetical protein